MFLKNIIFFPIFILVTIDRALRVKLPFERLGGKVLLNKPTKINVNMDINNRTNEYQFRFQAYSTIVGILNKLTHDMEMFNIIELFYCTFM